MPCCCAMREADPNGDEAGTERPRCSLTCLESASSPSGIGDCPMPIDDIAAGRTARSRRGEHGTPDPATWPPVCHLRGDAGRSDRLSNIGQSCVPVRRVGGSAVAHPVSSAPGKKGVVGVFLRRRGPTRRTPNTPAEKARGRSITLHVSVHRTDRASGGAKQGRQTAGPTAASSCWPLFDVLAPRSRAVELAGTMSGDERMIRHRCRR